MPNPMLNDDRLRAAAAASDSQAGWAAPQPGTQWNPPITDGPVTKWQSGVMTVAGTAQVTAILLGLLVVSAAFGWAAVKVDTNGNAQFPALAIVGIIVGVACVFGLMFKPQLAKILAPIYAIGQGFAVGAVSRGYETYQDGIVIQAVGATLGVFLVMLFLYRTNVIKVNDKYRRIVVGATLGIMVFYGVSLLIRLFGGNVPFLDSPSAFGIIFSLVVAAVAAANLALDFDFIERGAQQRLPKNVEWFAAFGLLVTIVWLYLEILRLLSKLNRR